MTERIRVAVIGAGIGREHLAAYQQLASRFHPLILCDLDTARAQEAAKASGFPADSIEITDDFAAVLVRPDIDHVDICLPPHLHLEACLKALEAGKHVVCEKPLVASLREADILDRAIQISGKTLTPVFQYRYGPSMAKMQALLESGRMGRPLVAHIETHWRRDASYYDNPWRGTWKGEQGGAVLGHAIHNHDLLCMIFGPVAHVSAFCTTRVNDIETEDCTAIAFSMQNGALATSSITLGAADDTTRLRFVFEHVTIESGRSPYAPATDPWTFLARGGVEDQAALDAFLSTVPTTTAGFVGFFEALADHLQHGGKNTVNFADGRHSLELVTAIYHAHRSGQQVSLPLDLTCPLYGSWLP